MFVRKHILEKQKSNFQLVLAVGKVRVLHDSLNL